VIGAVALAAACRAVAALGPERGDLDRGASDRDDLDRIGVVTFTVDGYPAALVAQFLSAEHGIGVRDGRFCAHPLLARFAADGVTADGAGIRASLGLGSRAEDVDRLLAALASLRAHGPAWTYTGPEAGYVPDPDPRALPDWLTSTAVGPASPCVG
jgi:selenocysteine lyase/cysteine desulfurase